MRPTTRAALLLATLLALAAAAARAQDEPAPLDAAALDGRALHVVATIASAVDERGAEPADVHALFGAELKQAVSEQVVTQLVGSMRAEGDVALELLDRKELPEGAGTRYRYHLVQDGSAWFTDVSLDPRGEPIGWYVGRGARHLPRARLVAETEALLGRWALACRLLEPAEDGGERVAVDLVLGADEPLPLGSVFKLYVLAELARRVRPGDLSLDQELAVREEWKSLPSGVLHTREAGTLVPLRELATKMIRISDNTATDHLMHFLGREALEARLAEYRNSVPERNTPFLTTLEMFLFKGIGNRRRGEVFPDGSLDAAALAWEAGTPAERRAWMDALLAAGLEGRTYEKLRGSLFFAYSAATFGSKEHQRVEWLARPRDVVELVTLAHRGQLVDARTSETFLELYGKGIPQYALPGVREQGYKGGSETGVYVLSARVAMEDGRTAIVCLSRAGLHPLDRTVPDRTGQLFNDWIRNLLEGDPVPEEAGGRGPRR